MGFLDKVKETASKAGQEMKKGAAQVKDKVGDAQLQHKADDNAKQIGWLVFKEKTAGETPPPGEIDRLVAEISELQQRIAEVPEILQQGDGGAVQAESAPGTPSEQAGTQAAPATNGDAPAG